MAKKAVIPENPQAPINDVSSVSLSLEPYRKVKVAQFHVGVELIGTKLSANHKNCSMLETPNGIELTSRKGSKEKPRVIVVPYANVRGYELL